MIADLLNGCLYFTANQLAREAGKIADEEFMSLGLSPTYAFLMLAVKEEPGITLTDLCKILNIAPSTGTRLIDKLIHKRLVERRTEGKLAKIFLTEKGANLHGDIKLCWDRLYERYSLIFGKEAGDELTKQALLASERIKNH
ncbi:MarR family transcriptional regulator [Paenibacillus doosanensis]|uniref:MarR family protein n=1 Tax=Paenibacillus konkukensis TaxID=2020716 RepID=A0ABY4RFW8_9BACL|nr:MULTISPECIES: MarR family transcriptional regulator [Paenibacillus]MCS7461332.1 MarR family transcriptional regulator [Paenibacillus doosanensis]UQZ81098.1 MarR family protein [Paenibacillus konkukensis]